MVYYGWASLLLNLPLTWLPKAVDALTKQAGSNGPLSNAVVLFGRKASLDCLLQAWTLWNGNSRSDIEAKAMFIAVIR